MKMKIKAAAASHLEAVGVEARAAVLTRHLARHHVPARAVQVVHQAVHVLTSSSTRCSCSTRNIRHRVRATLDLSADQHAVPTGCAR